MPWILSFTAPDDGGRLQADTRHDCTDAGVTDEPTRDQCRQQVPAWGSGTDSCFTALTCERWVSDDVTASRVLILTSLLHSHMGISHSLKENRLVIHSPAREIVCCQQAGTLTLEMKGLVYSHEYKSILTLTRKSGDIIKTASEKPLKPRVQEPGQGLLLPLPPMSAISRISDMSLSLKTPTMPSRHRRGHIYGRDVTVKDLNHALTYIY